METEITLQNNEVVQTQVIKTSLADYIAEKQNEIAMKEGAIQKLHEEIQAVIAELSTLIEE